MSKKKNRKKVAALVAALSAEVQRWEDNTKTDVDFGDYGTRRAYLAKRDAYRDALALVNKHLG